MKKCTFVPNIILECAALTRLTSEENVWLWKLMMKIFTKEHVITVEKNRKLGLYDEQVEPTVKS